MSAEWVREGLVSAMSMMGAWTAKRAVLLETGWQKRGPAQRYRSQCMCLQPIPGPGSLDGFKERALELCMGVEVAKGRNPGEDGFLGCLK